MSLLRTQIVCAMRGINVLPMIECGNAIVEHARNVLVQQFLDSPADRLLFVDSDLSWDEGAVLLMYQSPYEVVGGTYPKKVMEGSAWLGHFGTKWDGDFVEATQLPAGFLMAKRSAFTRMADKGTAPEYYDPRLRKKTRAWFETCIRSGALNGEDYEFCERYKAAGGSMWCLPDIYFEHTGRKIWQGNFLETLNASSAQRSEHVPREDAGLLQRGAETSSEVHPVSPDAGPGGEIVRAA